MRRIFDFVATVVRGTLRGLPWCRVRQVAGARQMHLAALTFFGRGDFDGGMAMLRRYAEAADDPSLAAACRAFAKQRARGRP